MASVDDDPDIIGLAVQHGVRNGDGTRSRHATSGITGMDGVVSCTKVPVEEVVEVFGPIAGEVEVVNPVIVTVVTIAVVTIVDGSCGIPASQHTVIIAIDCDGRDRGIQTAGGDGDVMGGGRGSAATGGDVPTTSCNGIISNLVFTFQVRQIGIVGGTREIGVTIHKPQQLVNLIRIGCRLGGIHIGVGLTCLVISPIVLVLLIVSLVFHNRRNTSYAPGSHHRGALLSALLGVHLGAHGHRSQRSHLLLLRLHEVLDTHRGSDVVKTESLGIAALRQGLCRSMTCPAYC